MIIIVDGYNVLKHHFGSKPSERNKQDLIKLLVLYARQKKHSCYLVFDGGFVSHPTKEQVGGITVVYAGYKRSADDYIRLLVEREQGKEIVLASSDNALYRSVAGPSIVRLDAQTFFDLLRDRAPTKIAQKEAPLERFEQGTADETLAQVMEEETKKIIDKDDKVGNMQRRSSVKSSKKERLVTRIIKKL